MELKTRMYALYLGQDGGRFRKVIVEVPTILDLLRRKGPLRENEARVQCSESSHVTTFASALSHSDWLIDACVCTIQSLEYFLTKTDKMSQHYLYNVNSIVMPGYLIRISLELLMYIFFSVHKFGGNYNESIQHAWTYLFHSIGIPHSSTRIFLINTPGLGRTSSKMHFLTKANRHCKVSSRAYFLNLRPISYFIKYSYSTPGCLHFPYKKKKWYRYYRVAGWYIYI